MLAHVVIKHDTSAGRDPEAAARKRRKSRRIDRTRSPCFGLLQKATPKTRPTTCPLQWPRTTTARHRQLERWRDDRGGDGVVVAAWLHDGSALPIAVLDLCLHDGEIQAALAVEGESEGNGQSRCKAKGKARTMMILRAPAAKTSEDEDDGEPEPTETEEATGIGEIDDQSRERATLEAAKPDMTVRVIPGDDGNYTVAARSLRSLRQTVLCTLEVATGVAAEIKRLVEDIEPPVREAKDA